VRQEHVLLDVVEALVDLGVTYMIAGSFASNVHGVPRMTHDADLVVDLDESAARALVQRLRTEFYVSQEAALEAVQQRRMFNALHLATGFKVDLVIRKDRPFSVEELRRRQPGDLAGRRVDFASAEDTILSKLEWAKLGGSSRHYDDALGVARLQRQRLDWDYLERWANEVGVAELLERVRREQPFER
jgi:hypothetical protein